MFAIASHDNKLSIVRCGRNAVWMTDFLIIFQLWRRLSIRRKVILSYLDFYYYFRIHRSSDVKLCLLGPEVTSFPSDKPVSWPCVWDVSGTSCRVMETSHNGASIQLLFYRPDLSATTMSVTVSRTSQRSPYFSKPNYFHSWYWRFTGN